jgi:hypothetical protein
MPRDHSLGLYLVRFTDAAGDHIAASHAPRYATPAQKAAVEKRISDALRPASVDFPEGNPDIRVTEIKLVDDPAVIQKAVDDLKNQQPNRVGADELGLDTPNRILNDPTISRDIAANQTPG